MTGQIDPPPGWAPLPAAPWAAPPPQAPLPPRRSQTAVILDVVATVVGWGLLGLVVVGCLYFSLFFGMATDSCYTGDACREDLVGTAFITVWAGGALAVVVPLIGTIVCLIKKWYVFYWPLIGIGIMAAGMAIGVAIIDNVAAGS
mgnify:CR=1 FL=1